VQFRWSILRAKLALTPRLACHGHHRFLCTGVVLEPDSSTLNKKVIFWKSPFYSICGFCLKYHACAQKTAMAGRARRRVLASFARKRDLQGTCRGLPGPGMLSAVSAFVCHGGAMACGLAPPEVAGLLVLCMFLNWCPQ
jgi:hypothetical protein